MDRSISSNAHDNSTAAAGNGRCAGPRRRGVSVTGLAKLLARTVPIIALSLVSVSALAAQREVERFAVHEVSLTASGQYANPYTELGADVIIRGPEGKRMTVPMFWDGGATWRFRVAADRVGEWRWMVRSRDAGLNQKSGMFRVVDSKRGGSIVPMIGAPHHFQRQDGSRFWFMGDTAWALFTDSEKEKHDRAAAQRYIDRRAAGGFNILHSMLMSEAGWGNRGGMPFEKIESEVINPGYWQEVDHRIAYANGKGIVCGLVLAWGDKRRVEPFAWRKFPNVEARKRYARYIAARYGAYDVYFIVAGEWHAEVRTREGTSEAEVRKEFFELGHVVAEADAHDRMIGIHPMTSHGSVREFNEAGWMSFADYQQNYHHLHARALESRRFNKPVVNAEYGYFLRDQSGDGVPDKDNSTSIETMRHATWDIVMAGAYVVTGFGTTYFGGHRDPGTFDETAEKNRPWEAQMGHMKRLFEGLEWWKLQPHDELVHCSVPRGADRRELKVTAPPATTYWCLAEPGHQYVIYARGVTQPVEVKFPDAMKQLRARLWNPRTGEAREPKLERHGQGFRFTPPDKQDWVLVMR